MTGHQNTTSSRIGTEPTIPEPSPSTGCRETAALLDAPNAHAVEPVDAHGCTALDCTADQDLRRVDRDDGTRRVLCPTHARDFLAETEVKA